jgi:glycosyltransferase involved in cell wall biosynthesis
LDCYIDGSTFEGWGLWTHAAMATGRPVIGTNYSARNDYFQFGNHIPIGYQLAPSQGMFTGLGHWAMPNHSDAVKAMRWAYNNRARCVEIAEEAAKTTRHLTWQAMAENVYKAMRKHKIRV